MSKALNPNEAALLGHAEALAEAAYEVTTAADVLGFLEDVGLTLVVDAAGLAPATRLSSLQLEDDKRDAAEAEAGRVAALRAAANEAPPNDILGGDEPPPDNIV
jgi:hypothetical protein